MLDVAVGLGLGSVAGNGRNRKAPTTVPAVPIGTRTTVAKKTSPARTARGSITGSVHHVSTPDRPAPARLFFSRASAFGRRRRPWAPGRRPSPPVVGGRRPRRHRRRRPRFGPPTGRA